MWKYSHPPKTREVRFFVLNEFNGKADSPTRTVSTASFVAFLDGAPIFWQRVLKSLEYARPVGRFEWEGPNGPCKLDVRLRVEFHSRSVNTPDWVYSIQSYEKPPAEIRESILGDLGIAPRETPVAQTSANLA